MKFFICLIVFLLFSCSYPDIDSVPDFKDLNLTNDELFDLCQLSSNVKTLDDRCLKIKK